NWLKLGPRVRIIQMWHAAGAFKTVGYSRVGKPTEADRFARVHKDYDAAIVSSDHDVPFYAEAFGIAEERVIPTGIPRMDTFFAERSRAAGEVPGSGDPRRRAAIRDPAPACDLRPGGRARCPRARRG